METAPARNGFAVKRSLMLLMMASVLLAAARPAATGGTAAADTASTSARVQLPVVRDRVTSRV